MKRKNNLYNDICNFDNIVSTFNEVCRNTKIKHKVDKFKQYKCIYIARIYNILESKKYVPGKYNVFTIYEPKERRIVSQNMQDKVINHLVARHILCIGAMTSQILAIFYLNDMDHFIKEELKIKYYVRYQDDFLLFHPSKQYLRYCLNKLTNFLNKEKLTLNSKTRIYKSTNNFLFLGHNKHNNYSRYRTVKRKLKKRKYLYKNNYINLSSLTSSIICYDHLCNKNKNVTN